jgi:hypothetical protein
LSAQPAGTEIKYTLEPVDYQRYYSYLYSRQLPLWAQIVIPTCLILPTIYVIAIGRNPLDYPIVAMCLIGFALFWWIRRIALRSPAQPQTSPERLLRLTPAGVQQTVDAETETVLWIDIIDITRTKEHLYLFVSANTAFVIPVRAFPDAQAAEAFYQQALQLRDAYMEHPFSVEATSAQGVSEHESETASTKNHAPEDNSPEQV